MNIMNIHNEDIDKRRKTFSIDTLLTEKYQGWQADYVRNSFYLPIQVLKNPDFRIDSIVVISGKQFIEVGYDKTAKLEGASIRMLSAAKAVGISHRKFILTDEYVVIVKLWYGSIPRRAV